MFSAIPDRRAYERDWAARLRPGPPPGLPEDPRGGAIRHRAAPDAAVAVRAGIVLDAAEALQGYRVGLYGDASPITCVPLQAAGSAVAGPRPMAAIPVGAVVWVLLPPDAAWGLILGVEPAAATPSSRLLYDRYHAASRCGIGVDETAELWVRELQGVPNWSEARPRDRSGGGEFGAITSTGMRILLDDVLLQCGADEQTGLSVFYADALTRLGGVHLQFHSAGHQHEILEDAGEVLDYHGATPYPWEQLGVLAPGTDPFREVPGPGRPPWLAPLEPVVDAQAPFHRVVRLGGYVGGGGRTLVQVPPPGGGTYALEPGPPPVGVFESSTSLAGSHLVRSAASLWWVKGPSIPAPRRIRRPEDPEGDSAETGYRAAGHGDDGVEHQVRRGLEDAESAAVPPHVVQAIAAPDALASVTWEVACPLHYHDLDWDLPEDGQTELGPVVIPDYAALAGDHVLPRPKPVTVEVDHRYGETTYYPNRSYFGLLDDGGVVLGDGYGAELRMTGGHIYLTCPGDLVLQPGRNLVGLAGRDAMLRAHGAVEASATDGSVRLKAERDVQVLAGNGGTGAVLLESKADGPNFDYEDKVGDDVVAGGVHLQGGPGGVTAWGDQCYLRATRGGGITLDADQGGGDVVTHARHAVRHLQEAGVDYFGTEGKVRAANRFTPEGTVLDGGLTVAGFGQFTGGGLRVRGHIVAVEGHVSTEQADTYDGLVGHLTGSPLDRQVEGLDEAEANQEEAVAAGEEDWTTRFRDYWYEEAHAGDPATIAAAGFSFRSDGQYRTGGWFLPEARWQREAKARGGAPGTWTERTVTAGSEETYPYPGRKAWVSDASWHQAVLELHDEAAGADRPRDPDRYGQPRWRDPESLPPDGNYTILP